MYPAVKEIIPKKNIYFQ